MNNLTPSTADPHLQSLADQVTFDNSYARELPGFYVAWQAAPAPAPQLLVYNHELAKALGLPEAWQQADVAAAIFGGNVTPASAQPLAMAYAGHQFGGFSPQLGDGRALLLGEVVTGQVATGGGARFDLHLKGSGRTPFSRGGDGKAAVGPMLREYILGEAMHALGIPTTRALAVVATGEPVFRETRLPGAVLTRVAASHIRVGTFQFFAARGDQAKVRQLADYTLARHFPQAAEAANPYRALLQAVVARQAKLIAQWMHVGFIHGVMNTDNMALSGETIDYGPCAFLDAFSTKTVFSSIDHGGRYAYGNQPAIARWNLARLAETLVPLLADDQAEAIAWATEAVNEFTTLYEEAWLQGMGAKFGIMGAAKLGSAPATAALPVINRFLALLQEHQQDFTQSFRALSALRRGGSPLQVFCAHPAFAAAVAEWVPSWQQLWPAEENGTAEGVAAEEVARTRDAAAARLDAVNPVYIPRNHLVEQALAAASQQQDLGPLHRLMDHLRQPFTPQPGGEEYAAPAADGNPGFCTFCGT